MAQKKTTRRLVLIRENTMNSYLTRLRSLCALLVSVLLSIGALEVFAQESLDGNPKVLVKTTDGDITVELFADKSPITVENFLQYVDDGYYNGTGISPGHQQLYDSRRRLYLIARGKTDPRPHRE
jgi:hypothetical protein